MVNIYRDGYTLKVEGNITKFDDYDAIKSEIEIIREQNNNKVVVRFVEAQSLISALIGYLIKLRRVDNVDLKVYANNPKLYNMLETLALVDILNVSKG